MMEVNQKQKVHVEAMKGEGREMEMRILSGKLSRGSAFNMTRQESQHTQTEDDFSS